MILTAANGTTVLDSILNFPAQQDDLAYGRTIEGATGFLTPTPQAVNSSTTLSGWLAPPTFSHNRGFYDQPFHPDALPAGSRRGVVGFLEWFGTNHPLQRPHPGERQHDCQGGGAP